MTVNANQMAFFHPGPPLKKGTTRTKQIKGPR